MKKALVIGSEGNVGKPLVQYLKENDYDVVAYDIKPGYRQNYYMADITKPIDLIKAFDFKPDYIFHLAAMVSRVTCEQSASMAIHTNIVGTQNIIELAKYCDAKLINFSTSEVYGPNNSIMDESCLPKPNNRYGLSKLLAEQLVEYEVKQHGLRAVTLRPFMIYDENEDLGDHRSAMIRFAYNLATGRSIEVHDGSARGWMHISDAVRAIEAATRVENYLAINIGNPDVRSIYELADMIRIKLGASEDLINVINLPNRMTLVKQPNLQRQKELLGFENLVSLEEGVDRVCENIMKRI
ncbi:NAD(P)-dependent oxidoreductase [Clostridium sp. CX1]|uniref:NAD-dependent epimerase/dehydratase family protein n=1 Tax=Clostridium sp. CX1 TaxID=2978346 RepID=UPI0021BF0173|nr:NAD(P)-dependent oxidoreductase [Clostridium sp. CX1]MCT8976128.1 NAD(P)-dependent oxidoreductase [Clostridium sp. CX1]